MSIEIERHGRVVIARLNRPRALNAINEEMMCALVTALEGLDRDPEVGCFVLTGSERAFAAATLERYRLKAPFAGVIAAPVRRSACGNELSSASVPKTDSE